MAGDETDDRFAGREVFTPWGKCSEELRLVIPAALDDSMREKAGRLRMSLAEYTRMVLFIGHFGMKETQDRFSSMLNGIGVDGANDGGNSDG